MEFAQRIKDFQDNLVNGSLPSSIFLNLADDIIKDFPYRLNKKTYLLIPNQKKELIDTSYEYLISNLKTIPIALVLNISEIMNKFIQIVKRLGFTVITSMDEYQNDGLLFDLLGNEANNNKLSEEECNKLPNIKVPLTLSVDEFALNPFLPAVFKNNTANRGEDKYLIETFDQLQKILTVLELPESKKINLKSEFIVQEYIKSFDGINSSIRIFTSCTGEILSSLFLVSADSKNKKRIKSFGIDVFNPCEYLCDSQSPYYLNSKNILSNAAAGGNVIPLNIKNKKIKAEDALILTLHDIDIDTFDLPNDIIEQCKNIARYWGTTKGVVLGIDFIYNSNDCCWYYLETNRNPSVDGYKYFMNLNGYIKKDIKSLMQLDSLLKIVEDIMTKDQKKDVSIKK